MTQAETELDALTRHLSMSLGHEVFAAVDEPNRLIFVALEPPGPACNPFMFGIPEAGMDAPELSHEIERQLGACLVHRRWVKVH